MGTTLKKSLRNSAFFFPTFTVLIVASASAMEIFPNDSATAVSNGTTVSGDVTVGGYPIYTGGRQWRILSHTTSRNNTGLLLGTTQLVSPEGGKYHAEINLTVNLGSAPMGTYFTADACSGGSSHLMKLSKPSGRDDDCLTLDMFEGNLNGNSVTTFKVAVVNTKSAGRFYNLAMYLNAASLGYTSTSKNDWTEYTLSQNAEKKRTVDQIFSWAKQIQDAVGRSTDFSKPADAFNAVPSLDTVVRLASASTAQTIASSGNSGTTLTATSTRSYPIAASWAGYNGLMAGTINLEENGQRGTMKMKLPNNDGDCSGMYEIKNPPSGTWAISCTNGMTAVGTYENSGHGNSSKGIGVDSKGNRVEFTMMY